MPECEVSANSRGISYNQTWLSNAIPLKNEKFESCLRFAPRNSTAAEPEKCSADLFDATTKIECNEFIHASDERNLQTEVKKLWDTFHVEKTFHFSNAILFVFDGFS